MLKGQISSKLIVCQFLGCESKPEYTEETLKKSLYNPTPCFNFAVHGIISKAQPTK